MKKTKIKKNSLQLKILLLVLAVGILPCLLITQGFLKLYEKRTVESETQVLLGQMQQMNNQLVTSGFLAGTKSKEIEKRLDYTAEAYGGRILIMNQSLKVILDTYGVDEGKTVVWDKVIKCAKGEMTSYYDKENLCLTVAVPLVKTENEEQIILGVYVVSKPMDMLEVNQFFFLALSSLFLFIIVCLVLLVAIFFSKRFTNPLHEMRWVLEKFETGYGDNLLEEHHYYETEELAKQFNSFLGRMKVIDDSRQEFVSNVSHELKTPLTSMKVLADSLIGMGDAPVELYKEFMNDIAEEIERETKIVNDLLSMVKMDKSADNLNISPVNMNDLLELILKRLKPIAERQEVDLVYESFRPVTAEIDEVKFTLAITNLVENGIKYNNPGGWVHVSINSDHQYFYIKVQDSGMGIPEESLEHIFERFYRVDKSHSREIGGTGLGLAITKSAIAMHQGEIKVHSVVGEGTVFDVRIPLNYIAKQEVKA